MLTALVFMLTAAFALWLIIAEPAMRTSHSMQMIVMAGATTLLVAAKIVFRKVKLGSVTGLSGGVLLLMALVLPQSPFQQAGSISLLKPWNPWIIFNLPDDPDGEIFLAMLKITAVGLVVLTVGCSALRLLPDGWLLRGSPLSKRTWPAFVASFLVLALWFLGSVRPYRIPRVDFVERIQPKLTLLHVQKHGMQFHETKIVQWSPAVLSRRQNNRRLFQYRFQEQATQGIIPLSIAARVAALTESAHLDSIQTQPAKPLRDWNAEGWYVLTESNKVLAFTTEYGTSPPKELGEIFQVLEAIPTSQTSVSYTKDVCLGFCYDPPAGLGLKYVNERCHRTQREVACR
jgi:hypothetical protein